MARPKRFELLDDEHAKAGSTLSFNLGREASLTRDPGGSSTSETPAYDNASNLSQLAQNLGNVSFNQTINLANSAVGQITSRAGSNASYEWSPPTASPQNYTPNGLNQYASVGGTSYSYDSRGNLTSDGTNTYTYDIYNRLLSRAATGLSAALSYDAGGRLHETSGTGATTARFLYGGANIIAEYDTSGNVLRRYVHGLSGPMVWYEGSGTSTHRWLIPDERGSIIARDNAGSVSVNTYDEYGQNGPSNAGRFQYVGLPWIGEAGVYQMGARNYAPGIGRWMQTDPILTAGGVNLYAYVGNDPVNLADPSGLMHLSCNPHYDGDNISTNCTQVADWWDFYGLGALFNDRPPTDWQRQQREANSVPVAYQCQPAGRNVSASAGGSGTYFSGPTGYNASAGVTAAISRRSFQLSGSFQTTTLHGSGVYGGIGATVGGGYSESFARNGVSHSEGQHAEAGYAVGLEGFSVSGDTSTSGGGRSVSASSGIRPSVGSGAYAGAGTSHTTTIATGWCW